MCRRPLATALFSLVLASPQAFAESTMSESELIETVRMLKDRIRQLEHQLEAQGKRIEVQDQRLEQVGGRLEAQQRRIAETAVPDGPGSSSRWFNDVEISGLVEVEASKTHGFDDEEASDIALATVELGIDARVYDDWVTAHLLALHEDDDTESWEIDEGIITIGNIERQPLYLAAGRMYVPFGTFESHMVSDPLTLEIGETREAAVQVGFESRGWYASAFAFNGDTTEGGDDEIEHFGLNLGFARELAQVAFDVGASFTNGLADADAIQDYLDAANGTQAISDQVSAWAAFGIVHVGPVTAIGEYVSAADNFGTAELPFNGLGAEPKAWNLELGYNFELFDKESTIAVGYQGSDEALSLGLPETRFLTTLSVGIFDKTTLSFEWAYDQDYDTGDTAVDEDGNAITGSDDDANSATVQLAVEI